MSDDHMLRVVNPRQFLRMQEELANPLRSPEENAAVALRAAGVPAGALELYAGMTTEIVVDFT